MEQLVLQGEVAFVNIAGLPPPPPPPRRACRCAITLPALRRAHTRTHTGPKYRGRQCAAGMAILGLLQLLQVLLDATLPLQIRRRVAVAVLQVVTRTGRQQGGSHLVGGPPHPHGVKGGAAVHVLQPHLRRVAHVQQQHGV